MILSRAQIREIDQIAKEDFLSATESEGPHNVTIICCRVGQDEDAFNDSVYGARCATCFSSIFHRPWVTPNVTKICKPCHARIVRSN